MSVGSPSRIQPHPQDTEMRSEHAEGISEWLVLQAGLLDPAEQAMWARVSQEEPR